MEVRAGSGRQCADGVKEGGRLDEEVARSRPPRPGGSLIAEKTVIDCDSGWSLSYHQRLTILVLGKARGVASPGRRWNGRIGEIRKEQQAEVFAEKM